MKKQYDVQEGEESFKVTKDYFDYIPLRNAVEFRLMNDHLVVTYKNGKTVAWDNVHGTWGSPTTLV